MTLKSLTTILLLAGALGLNGCRTPRQEAYLPYSDPRVKAFLAESRDARGFWLHEYESTSGETVFVGGHRIHPNQVCSLPFKSLRRSVMAPLILISGRRDKQYLALIDSTSKENWISFRMALELGLVPIGPPPHALQPVHVLDTSRGILTTIDKLKFADLHMENPLFYVRLTDQGLGPLIRDEKKSHPQMVLGCDLLRAFRYVQFNYPARSVVLSSTLPYTPNAQRLVASVPLLNIGGTFAVEGIIDEYHGPILLDFAGDYHVASTTPNAEYAQHASLGELVFRNVPAATPTALGLGYPTSPRIGRRLLSRFKVTVDNKQKRVYFERPEKKHFL